MLVDNPQFITSDGTTFFLQPIAILLMDRFLSEWRKKNPKPKPPVREATLIDKKILVPDDKNEYYLSELGEWAGRQERTQITFVYAFGVKNNPPDEWGLDPELFGDLKGYERKASWIESHLLTAEDMELAEQILSLTNPTAKAIEEEEKK